MLRLSLFALFAGFCLSSSGYSQDYYLPPESFDTDTTSSPSTTPPSAEQMRVAHPEIYRAVCHFLDVTQDARTHQEVESPKSTIQRLWASSTDHNATPAFFSSFLFRNGDQSIHFVPVLVSGSFTHRWIYASNQSEIPFQHAQSSSTGLSGVWTYSRILIQDAGSASGRIRLIAASCHLGDR